MSFILNALRKSEQERESIQSKALRENIDEKPNYTEKKKPFWLILISLINLLFLAWIVWFFILKTETDKEKNRVSENQKTIVEANKIIKPYKEAFEPREADEPREVVVKIKEVQKTEVIMPREVVRPIKVAKPKKTIALEKAVKNKSVSNETITKPKPRPRKETDQLSIAQQLKKRSLKQNQKKQDTFQSKTTKNPRLAKKQNQRLENSTEKPFESGGGFGKPVIRKDNPPYLTGMSYEFRRTVPDIRINVFVYTEREEDRMIMINMKKYRTGQEIANNMELKEIRKNSIVVKYKGEIFQIKR